MAKICRPFDELTGLGDRVHLAHICVQMELYALLRRVIDYSDLLDSRYRFSVDDRITGELIELYVAGYDDGRTLLDILKRGAVLDTVKYIDGR